MMSRDKNTTFSAFVHVNFREDQHSLHMDP